MSRLRLAVVTMLLALLSGTRVQAQQPQKPDSMTAGMMAMSGNCMRPAANQRLSHLVDVMNAAPSNRRVAAMMAVINELAAQNREMHAHMMGMMHGMQMSGMMQGMPMTGMMQPPDSAGARRMGKAPAQPEPLKPAPDSADHEEHH